MRKDLELPWSIEDTIKNIKDLRDILIKQVINTDHEGKGKTDAKEIKFDFNRAISALEQQLTDAWIPVKSGRLPEGNSQRVLVTLKNEMVLEVWHINNAFKFVEPLSAGGFEKVSDYNPVIAWRPLPQPYKEVQP